MKQIFTSIKLPFFFFLQFFRTKENRHQILKNTVAFPTTTTTMRIQILPLLTSKTTLICYEIYFGKKCLINFRFIELTTSMFFYQKAIDQVR